MDTVVTVVKRDWVELTAPWAAATPPAVDGEVITVQPGDEGMSHAIEVIQVAADPAAGRRGHLIAGHDTLTVTGAAGRKHYGRAYMGAATIVATGEGLSGERGGGSGGGGGNGAIGGGSAVILHGPAAVDPMPNAAPLPGSVTGIAPALADLQAISDGVLSIGGSATAAIDLSAVTTLAEVAAAVQTAIQAVAGLSSYTLSLSSNLFVLRNPAGDAGAVAGTLAVPLGFTAGQTVVAHEPPSTLVLPAPPAGTVWGHLEVDLLGETYRGANCRCRGTYTDDGVSRVSWYDLVDNASYWNVGGNEDTGTTYAVGLLQGYNRPFYSIEYDPATRTLSTLAVPGTVQPAISAFFRPKVSSLMVRGWPRAA